MSRFARSRENYNFCQKLEKSLSRCKPVKKGPDKVCDFCENAKNAIIVKSTKNWKNRRVDVNLWKRASTSSAIFAKTAKTAIMVKNLRKIEKNGRVDVNPLKRAPARSAIFAKTAKIAIIVKSAKNWKNRRVDVNLSKRTPTRNCKNCKYWK